MITFSEQYQIFKVDTLNTTYAFKVVHGRYLVHLYYGKRIDDFAKLNLMYEEREVSFAPYPPDIGNQFSLETVLTELSFFDSGDNKESAIKIEHDGSCVTAFAYCNYRIFNGRIPLDGMPYSRGGDQTLEIIYFDSASKIELHSYYVTFEQSDTITRFNRFYNCGTTPVVLRNAMSCQLDFSSGKFQLGYLAGIHRQESNYQENEVHIGIQSIYSKRGHSSHQFNPFALLKTRESTNTYGDVFGVQFVYSGDFVIQVERTFTEKVRLLVGINPDTFMWYLTPHETFFTPEVILTYSHQGVGQMSRNFHDHIREHIIPAKFAYKKRPIVLNTWEAVHFNVSEDLLLSYAEKVKGIGIDTLVVDDGWFGARNDDKHSLGDWEVNKTKFPNGLKEFSEKVHSMGFHLGIWIEPEMINPDSDCYRQHPDWVLGSKDRTLSLGRNQLVLDLCNEEVINYIVNSLVKTLNGVQLEYIKWDFNRSLSEAFSRTLPKERQGEVKRRFQLGSYKLHKRITEAFPEVLFEGCSGGGGRFDAGTLFYCPQIWTSDNTDPIDRTRIQYNTSIAYPLSTISSHISKTLTNNIEKKLDLGLRFAVASCGILGYELDVKELSQEDIEQIAQYNATYREMEDIILRGDLFREKNTFSVVSKNKQKAYIVCVNLELEKEGKLFMNGLDEGSYLDRLTGTIYHNNFSKPTATFDFNGKKYRYFVLEKI